MTTRENFLQNKDLIFYLSDFLDDKTALNLFKVDKSRNNFIINYPKRYKVKNKVIDLGYINNLTDLEDCKEQFIISFYNYKYTSIDIIFTLHFLLDYDNTVYNENNDDNDIIPNNYDDLEQIYENVYIFFSSTFPNKTVSIKFIDEYNRIFFFSSDEAGDVNIIIDILNYHYEDDY